MERVYPIILCGGAATRLWPASRPSYPKQFTKLVDPTSMFRQTLARLDILDDLNGLIVVANQSHRATIEAQLPNAGPPATLIMEPIARDSGAAIAVAAVLVALRDPDGVALVLPSDHFIPKVEEFGSAAKLAIRTAADHGAIVTFGLEPTSPSTAYGYILPGAALGRAFRVEAFAEKPDAVTAEQYVKRGYLWNSGMFVARASVLIDELEAFAPEVLAAARAAVADARFEGRTLNLGRAFEAAPKMSFDYAVMEKTARAAVVPTAMTWSDLPW